MIRYSLRKFKKSTFSKTHLNINVPKMPTAPPCIPTKFEQGVLLSCAAYIFRPSHTSWINCSSKVRWTRQTNLNGEAVKNVTFSSLVQLPLLSPNNLLVSCSPKLQFTMFPLKPKFILAPCLMLLTDVWSAVTWGKHKDCSSRAEDVE